MMTENNIGMWRQWMRGAAGKDYFYAIDELCDLAIAGLKAAPQVPAMVTSGSEGEIATAKGGIAEVATQCPVDTPAVAAPSSPSAASHADDLEDQPKEK
jgi:hypothetical protein